MFNEKLHCLSTVNIHPLFSLYSLTISQGGIMVNIYGYLYLPLMHFSGLKVMVNWIFVLAKGLLYGALLSMWHYVDTIHVFVINETIVKILKKLN